MTESQVVPPMVEAVARVLCVKCSGEISGDPEATTEGPASTGIWLEEGEPHWTAFVDAARAAIAAMLEIAPAVSERGAVAVETLMGADDHEYVACTIWHAMIDAALGEAP